jgi:hypothetical protein
LIQLDLISLAFIFWSVSWLSGDISASSDDRE